MPPYTWDREYDPPDDEPTEMELSQNDPYIGAPDEWDFANDPGGDFDDDDLDDDDFDYGYDFTDDGEDDFDSEPFDDEEEDDYGDEASLPDGVDMVGFILICRLS